MDFTVIQIYQQGKRLLKSLLKGKELKNNNDPSNICSTLSPTSTHDQLRCSIPIVTAITRSSHICSHQGIGDHCKKENHTRRQTQARRV